MRRVVGGAAAPADRAPRRRALGLRVDVDTHDGMKLGVPALLDLLAAGAAAGTFYLTMGLDRSGRAIFNLLRPGFLAKMRRTGAARVYGLRTVLSGTLLPGRPVATAFPELARRVRAEGHEVGVHAWDHRRWQDRLLGMSDAWVADQLERGRAAFVRIFGFEPATFAAPAWLSSESSLVYQERFHLSFASDCRGERPFLPVIGGRRLATPQVPTTLPTLDEALGFTHADADAFFADMTAAALQADWPVLTVHAELEGGPYAEPFARFLRHAAARGLAVVPLGVMLAERQERGDELPACTMGYAPVPGRHGVISLQGGTPAAAPA
jgi:undecaprenyl phosphate-alpha-L-ara4FN deformylase